MRLGIVIGLALFALAVLAAIVVAVDEKRVRAWLAAVALGAIGPALAWPLAPRPVAIAASAIATGPAVLALIWAARRARFGPGDDWQQRNLLSELWRACEQPMALAADVARLRAYAQAAALAARSVPQPIPAPPEAGRPGGDQAWEALIDSWEAARAAAELHRSGLASHRPYARACRALSRHATELADALAREDAAGRVLRRASDHNPARAGPAGLVALIPNGDGNNDRHG